MALVGPTGGSLLSRYREIINQQEMDALIGRVSGFHDSMAKELHILNRGWVGADRTMTMTHQFDLRLLVQSQFDPLAVELLFINVEQLSIGNPAEFDGATGTVEHEDAPRQSVSVTMSFDTALRIIATRLFVLDRPNWTGVQARFGTEVPMPGCTPAKLLDSSWRQCAACADAFKAPLDEVYAVCTGCGVLTELER